MIIDHTFKHPGLYVEGRYFGDKFNEARSFAFALACEYMRPIKVWHNAPTERHPTRDIDEVLPELANAA